MPLNYRRSGITYQINLYDSTNVTWGASFPVRQGGVTKYAQLDTNISHDNASYMRVRKDGTTHAVLTTQTQEQYLWVWGAITDYVGSYTLISSPVQIGSDYDWAFVTSGSEISGPTEGSLKTNQTLWMTGENQDGQLGLGDRVDRSYLTQVGSDTDWEQLQVGSEFSFAKRTDGSIWSWGFATYGQCGREDKISRSSPTQIGSDTDWNIIEAGGSWSLAIKTDGSLWGWGVNNGGTLGLGDTIWRSSPVQIGGDIDWSQVSSAAGGGSAAIRTDGTLWTWGFNNIGQLAQGDAVYRSSPTQVGGDTDWSLIHAVGNQVYAMKNNGSIWGWGQGSYGQLAQGNLVHKSSPVQMGSDTDWVTIRGFSNWWLAIKSNGTLWGCGRGDSGELAQGDSGVSARRSSPVQIGSDTNWAFPKAGEYGATACIRYA